MVVWQKNIIELHDFRQIVDSKIDDKLYTLIIDLFSLQELCHIEFYKKNYID